MTDEDIFIGVIIAQRGHPAHVVIERKDSKTFAQLVGGTFAEIGGEVGCVGGAAAVAKNKNLPVFLERLPELFDQFRDRINRNGFVRRLLRFQIIGDPLIHAAA